METQGPLFRFAFQKQVYNEFLCSNAFIFILYHQAYDNNSRPKEATILGFGSLKYAGSSPCTLYEARILIYSDKTCKDMIDSTGNNGSGIVHALCAGYLTGGIDACQVIICYINHIECNSIVIHFIKKAHFRRGKYYCKVDF